MKRLPAAIVVLMVLLTSSIASAQTASTTTGLPSFFSELEKAVKKVETNVLKLPTGVCSSVQSLTDIRDALKLGRIFNTCSASSTPPTPPPPVADTLGPWITSLSITPKSGTPGTIVTFTVTAQDPAGVSNVIYDIQYPASPAHDGPFGIQPNCKFAGETSATCSFSQPIDQATIPTIFGDYVITDVRAVDVLGNVSTFFPNGTVTNSNHATHSLTIPVITIHQ